MSFLLDTKVISEVTRPRPDEAVARWIKSAAGPSLFVSVLTLGELRKGIERLGSGPRKESLRHWLESELPGWFEDRVLPVDAVVADRWGRLSAAARRSVPAIDALLAATALAHGLRLVTRNRGDFAFPGLEVLDPWEPRPGPS